MHEARDRMNELTNFWARAKPCDRRYWFDICLYTPGMKTILGSTGLHSHGLSNEEVERREPEIVYNSDDPDEFTIVPPEDMERKPMDDDDGKDYF